MEQETGSYMKGWIIGTDGVIEIGSHNKEMEEWSWWGVLEIGRQHK